MISSRQLLSTEGDSLQGDFGREPAVSQPWLMLLAAGNECLGREAGLGGTLRQPPREGACQHWTPSRGMLWVRAQALDSREDTTAGPTSLVWASRRAGPAYPWLGSRMPENAWYGETVLSGRELGMGGVARVGCQSHEHQHRVASLSPCVPSPPVVPFPTPQ